MVEVQRNYTWSEPNTHYTDNGDIFLLASVSKAFACAAIYNLFPDEETRKKTMAFSYLGYTKPPNDSRINTINIQMLCDHTAGFDDNPGGEYPNDPHISPDWSYNAREVAANIGHNVMTAKDIVDFVQTQQLDYTPFDDKDHNMFRYSNTGFIILSEIVAKASEMSYYQYLSQAVLQPLGLNVTHIGTQLNTAGYGAVLPESFATGLPSYNYQDNTTYVPAVYGGDGKNALGRSQNIQLTLVRYGQRSMRWCMQLGMQRE